MPRGARAPSAQRGRTLTSLTNHKWTRQASFASRSRSRRRAVIEELRFPRTLPPDGLVDELRGVRRCAVPRPCPVISTEVGGTPSRLRLADLVEDELLDGERSVCESRRLRPCGRVVSSSRCHDEAVDKTREDFEDTLKPGPAGPPLKPRSFWGRQRGRALRKSSLPARAQSRETPGTAKMD